MQLQIVGTTLPGRDCGANGNFPGYTNIHVGLQRENKPAELLDLHPGDAARAIWTVDCAVDGADVRGPYIQGPPGGRFVYLSWGAVDDGVFSMFRRAKLMLEDVPADVLAAATKPVDRDSRADRCQGQSGVRTCPAAADHVDGGTLVVRLRLS